MAITVEELAAHLEDEGLKYSLENSTTILSGFRTEHYVNANNGEKGIIIVIQVTEDGEYIQVFSPDCYLYPADGPHAASVFQALLFTSWRTKLVQFEYEPQSGEVRAIVEWPVEDGTVTRRQLLRAMHGMAQIVDLFDPLIRKAMEEGKFDPSLVSGIKAEAFVTMLEKVVAELRQQLEGRGSGAAEASDDEEPLDLED